MNKQLTELVVENNSLTIELKRKLEMERNKVDVVHTDLIDYLIYEMDDSNKNLREVLQVIDKIKSTKNN